MHTCIDCCSVRLLAAGVMCTRGRGRACLEQLVWSPVAEGDDWGFGGQREGV